MQKATECFQPKYKGKKWLHAKLPEACESWPLVHGKSIKKDAYHRSSFDSELEKILQQEPWVWPTKTLYFISDVHADSDAFWASVVASGGVRKTGPNDEDFKLTGEGRKAHFLIGGDCFDKGPSNLRLLKCMRLLIDKGATVKLLAGNHDIRTMLGIGAVGLDRTVTNEHFFIRMGPKALPFLKEVFDQYLSHKHAMRGLPSTRECRRLLYPGKKWFKEFPAVASWSMPDRVIDKELRKMRKKVDAFEKTCEQHGMTLRMVYAAVKKWQALFLEPDGEFSWFFKRMRLCHQDGSFLFIHAGLDDVTAKLIHQKGITGLNRKFWKKARKDPFEFYYGPLANAIRTKYRDVDRPLSRTGVKLLNQSGIHAIVHGHHSLRHGQNIMLRKGLVNFECDTTMDAGSRKKENLPGSGAAVTVIQPDGKIIGISTDHSSVKVFAPQVKS